MQETLLTLLERGLMSKIFSLLNSIRKGKINKIAFYSLLIFNFVFLFLMIAFNSFFISSIFFLVNLISIICLFTKNQIITLFFSYFPFARVMKFPGVSTSILTIFIALFALCLTIDFFAKFKVISKNKKIIFILFCIYCGFTGVISLINFVGFTINQLISFYCYLYFPIICILTFKKEDVSVNLSLIIFFLAYFLALIYMLLFVYVIPNGVEMLKNSGVKIFDQYAYGIRLSPLTDDPNYGIVLIICYSALFASSKRTKKESFIGFPLIFLSVAISLITESKMLIICLIISLFYCAFIFYKKHDNPLFPLYVSIFFMAGIIVLLSTEFGNTILIRFIGNDDNITLNRITSGRTNLFEQYSNYILNNPNVLIFGKGPLYHNLDIFTSGEHNTFTRNILGSGLVGVSIMLYIFVLLIKERFDSLQTIPKNNYFILFLILLFLCCMSLCVAPSTCFPLIILAAQYVDLTQHDVVNLEVIDI